VGAYDCSVENEADSRPAIATTEVWAQLWLCPEDCARIRDVLTIQAAIKRSAVIPRMHLTVYYARRWMPGVRPTLTFNGLNAFLMERAGDRTLAARLREDGRLSGEFLQRFGDDLLDLLEFLEHEGVPHRDLKPDNIDVREHSKQLHLKLFDFSLSRLPLDNIRAGTPDYMEPFLALRPRWDPHAERFSAAIVLYEMATGALPRWGNGQSAPHLIADDSRLAVCNRSVAGVPSGLR
jgi:serine/threonine protein kinase